MAAPTIPEKEKLVSIEEFAEMDDLGRAELFRGKIIKMGPPKSLHGRMVANFTIIIGSFVRENALGVTFSGESGVIISRNPATIRGMDVAFISNDRWAKQPDPDGYLEVGPNLIVEVLSPTDRWNDVTEKLEDYFSIGVDLVWIAEPKSKTFYAYKSLTEIQIFRENDLLTAGDILPNFNTPIQELFS